MENIEKIITIEKIMSGEIAGRKAIEFLAKTGDYVFHGSWQKLSELEPRQPYSHKKADGKPSVCASEEHEISIFKSLVNTPTCKTQKRFSGWSTGENENNDITFSATKGAMEGAERENAIGYVHVFRKSDFKKYQGMEYRTDKNIKPLFVVEVKKTDLPKDIKIVEK